MVWVDLNVILGYVRQWPKAPRLGGCLDRCPKRQGAEVIWDRALTPSLRGTGLRLSMAPGLDGVMDIVVVADLVARGGAEGKARAFAPIRAWRL